MKKEVQFPSLFAPADPPEYGEGRVISDEQPLSHSPTFVAQYFRDTLRLRVTGDGFFTGFRQKIKIS
jgi:hypothetical protein